MLFFELNPESEYDLFFSSESKMAQTFVHFHQRNELNNYLLSDLRLYFMSFEGLISM